MKKIINKTNTIILTSVIFLLVLANIFTLVQKTSYADSSLEDVVTDIKYGKQIVSTITLNKNSTNNDYIYDIDYEISKEMTGVYAEIIAKTSAWQYPTYTNIVELKDLQGKLATAASLGKDIGKTTITISFFRYGKVETTPSKPTGNVNNISSITKYRRRIAVDLAEEGVDIKININMMVQKDYGVIERTTRWEAPQDGVYEFELWGAAGNYYPSYNKNNAGSGAYTKGRITLKKGTVLYIYIGENATSQGTYYSSSFNGGSKTLPYDGGHHMSSGGGATDIRYFGSHIPTQEELKWNSTLGLRSRVMVAGGGGGTLQQNQGNFSQTGSGGAAGGLIGYKGSAIYHNYDEGTTEVWDDEYPLGGTQTAGGIGGGICRLPSLQGSFGIGGNGGLRGPIDDLQTCIQKIYDKTGNRFDDEIYALGNIGGGGGGGYYGGGGGASATDCHSGGAGGSSYISGHQGSVAVDRNGNPICTETEAKTNKACSNHYSGLIFTDTEMIDGKGYKWTTERDKYTGMPSPSGDDNIVGNTGEGAVRIKLIEEKPETEEDIGTITLVKYEKTLNDQPTTTKIANVKFDLYSEDNFYRKTYVTDETGKLEISKEDLVLNRNYYLIENESAPGYEKDNTKYRFTATKEPQTINAYNKRKPASIKILKTDEFNKPLDGIQFDLYNSSNAKIGSYETNLRGEITINNLEWSDYYLVETRTLKGYKLAPRKDISIGQSNAITTETINIINEQQKGSVKLTKYNYNETVKLGGAIYNLYKSDGTLFKEGLRIGTNGELTVTEIPWGSYYFKETTPPAGYGMSEEYVRFTISNTNSQILQELVATDPDASRTVEITKTINKDEVVFAHGNPTFIFKLTGTDTTGNAHTYYKELKITNEDYKNSTGNTISKKVIMTEIKSGNYTLTEDIANRYETSTITNVTGGTVNNKSVVFDLINNATGKATYVNTKINQEGISHVASITNIVKAKAKLTAIMVSYRGTEKLKVGHNIDRNLINVIAVYDDGEERQLANNEYNLSSSALTGDTINTDATGTQGITVSYTYHGLTRRGAFNIEIAPSYTIYITQPVSTEGTISIKNNTTNKTYTNDFKIAAGDSITVTVSPIGTCKLTSLTENGAAIANGRTITVNSNYTYQAAFQCRVWYYRNGTYSSGLWGFPEQGQTGSTPDSGSYFENSGGRLHIYTNQGRVHFSNVIDFSNITRIYVKMEGYAEVEGCKTSLSITALPSATFTNPCSGVDRRCNYPITTQKVSTDKQGANTYAFDVSNIRYGVFNFETVNGSGYIYEIYGE